MVTSKIEIEDAKMCTDQGRMILWVTLKNKDMEAQAFIAKSKVDTKVWVKKRFPTFPWDQLKFLESLAAEKKENNVYNQICPGLWDLQILEWFGYKSFCPVSLADFLGVKLDQLPEFFEYKEEIHTERTTACLPWPRRGRNLFEEGQENCFLTTTPPAWYQN